MINHCIAIVRESRDPERMRAWNEESAPGFKSLSDLMLACYYVIMVCRPGRKGCE